MKQNSKLSLALHALGHLAAAPGELRTSAQIAAHNRTNAVVVRRVLGQLREAGLVTSQKGHAGGWKLARRADRITLADVYSALGDRFVAAVDPAEETSSCGIEAALRQRVGIALVDAENRLVERLAESTIDQLALR